MFGLFGKNDDKGGDAFKKIANLEEKLEKCEEENKVLKEKLESLPLSVKVKHDLVNMKGFFVDNTTFFKQVKEGKTDSQNKIGIRGRTLLVGATGSGKDWMIKKLIQNSCIPTEKVFYIGLSLDYEEKYGYLKAQNFERFSLKETIPKGCRRIFVEVLPDEKDGIGKVTSMLEEYKKNGYTVIINDEVLVSKGSVLDEIMHLFGSGDALIITSQTLRPVSSYLKHFDTIVAFRNVVAEDIEILGEIFIKDFDKGEHILYERVA